MSQIRKYSNTKALLAELKVIRINIAKSRARLRDVVSDLHQQIDHAGQALDEVDVAITALSKYL